MNQGRTSMEKWRGGGEKEPATCRQAAGRHAWLVKPRLLQLRASSVLSVLPHVCVLLFVSVGASKGSAWLAVCVVTSPEYTLSISTDWAQKSGTAAASLLAD